MFKNFPLRFLEACVITGMTSINAVLDAREIEMNVTSLLVVFLDFLAEKTHYHGIYMKISGLMFT